MSKVFDLPLLSTLVPVVAAGSGTPSFSRASTAYNVDHENVWRLCKSGEARFRGARRVQNYARAIPSWSNQTDVTLVTGKADPFGGTTAVQVTAVNPFAFFVDDLSAIMPTTAVGRNSLWLRRVSGTGAVLAVGDGITATDISANLTSSWKRFAAPLGTPANVLLIGVAIADATDVIEVAYPQAENVVGQTNQNPAENVSFGVLAPPYHGANVDGVKNFSTTNGNTIVSNVVVAAEGTAIPAATLRKYWYEQVAVNNCLWSEDFTNAAWVKTGVTPTANTDLAPNGTMTMDTLTATAPNGTVFQTIVSASAPKAFSLWLKRKVGSGAVHITMDGGGTYTLVPLTTTPTRFPIYQTLANEVIGFRIATSGDAIAAWGAQDEPYSAGDIPRETSYIPTTSAPASRDIDMLSYPSAGNVPQVNWTAYYESQRDVFGGNSTPVCSPLSFGTYSLNASVTLGNYGGSIGATTSATFLGAWPNTWDASLGSPGNDISLGVQYRAAFTMAPNGLNLGIYINGAGATGVASNPKASNWGATLNIGNMPGGSGVGHSVTVGNVKIWNTVMPIKADGTVGAGGSVWRRRGLRLR